MICSTFKFTKKMQVREGTPGIVIEEMPIKADLQEFTVTVIPVEDYPAVLVIPKGDTFPDTIALLR